MDVSFHLKALKCSVGCDLYGFKSSAVSEGDLIYRRVGLFTTNHSMTVCPHHRFRLGIGFRQGKACYL